jgi:carbon storage regulator CsrA
MLVFSRKEGERIRIGAAVCVTLLSCGSRRARLGIEAPSNTLILRNELMAPSWKIPARFPNDPVTEAPIRDVVFDLFNGLARSERAGYVGHLNRILEAVDPRGTRDGRRLKGDPNERK